MPAFPAVADAAIPRPTRRRVLAGGLGALALAAAGVPLAVRALQPAGPGKLVPELLAAHPFYVAHRGGSADWPEMSMFAYRSAVERGVDALEISLARSSDGVWFGLHDATLDRTSGTGLVAARTSWAQISALRIRPQGAHAAGQEPQPYLRLEELIDAYAATHSIFVDPKVVDPAHYGELVAILDKAVSRPHDSFVAKSYGTGAAWPALARRSGYRTWGYYYGSQIASGETPLAATQDRWDLLGLDVDAPAAVWRQVLALGRPVAAHVVADAPAARRALGAGAQGLVVSGVLEVLPPPS